MIDRSVEHFLTIRSQIVTRVQTCRIGDNDLFFKPFLLIFDVMLHNAQTMNFEQHWLDCPAYRARQSGQKFSKCLDDGEVMVSPGSDNSPTKKPK